jgi:hypothetical protein
MPDIPTVVASIKFQPSRIWLATYLIKLYISEPQTKSQVRREREERKKKKKKKKGKRGGHAVLTSTWKKPTTHLLPCGSAAVVVRFQVKLPNLVIALVINERRYAAPALHLVTIMPRKEICHVVLPVWGLAVKTSGSWKFYH